MGLGNCLREEGRLTAEQAGGVRPRLSVCKSTTIPEVVMNLKTLGACLVALLTFTVTPAYSQDEGQRASTGVSRRWRIFLRDRKDSMSTKHSSREPWRSKQSGPISGNLGTLGASRIQICIVVFGTLRQRLRYQTIAMQQKSLSRMVAWVGC